MKKRQLSRRERDMMEEAITRVCKAMGLPEKDPELRQVAWAALLDVYRDDPAGFTGGRMRGWRRAYRLAWDALEAERKDRWRSLPIPALPGQAPGERHREHLAATAPLAQRRL